MVGTVEKLFRVILIPAQSRQSVTQTPFPYRRQNNFSRRADNYIGIIVIMPTITAILLTAKQYFPASIPDILFL